MLQPQQLHFSEESIRPSESRNCYQTKSMFSKIEGRENGKLLPPKNLNLGDTQQHRNCFLIRSAWRIKHITFRFKLQYLKVSVTINLSGPRNVILHGWQYRHAPPRHRWFCRHFVCGSTVQQVPRKVSVELTKVYLHLERHLEAEKTTRENIRDPRLHWWKFWGDLSIITEFIDLRVIGFEILFPAFHKYINGKSRKL